MGEEARPLSEARCGEITKFNEELAGQALRTLGIAFRRLTIDAGEADESVERDLVFAGLIGMIDPPREEAKEARQTSVWGWPARCCGCAN